MKLTRTTLRGPWAGLPVAWTAEMEFDDEAYRRDVTRCCQAGVPGVYTAGTSGEFYAMEFDEFQAVTEATVAVCRAHRVPVMIGCTSTYTRGVVRRAEFAAACGADAIQVALPYWMPLGDAEVVPFFREIAAGATGLALSIYENQRSGRLLSFAEHCAIKESVPEYLMVKANQMALGRTADGCRRLSEFVNVFVSENLWSSLGPAGVAGSCSSLIYWFPPYLLAYWREVEAKNWPAVTRRGAELDQLFAHFETAYAGRGFTDSAYDRLGGAATGFLSGGLRCRHPYASATAADAKQLRAWIEAHFPQMLET